MRGWAVKYWAGPVPVPVHTPQLRNLIMHPLTLAPTNTGTHTHGRLAPTEELAPTEDWLPLKTGSH
jgi:hypothetical protein